MVSLDNISYLSFAIWAVISMAGAFAVVFLLRRKSDDRFKNALETSKLVALLAGATFSFIFVDRQRQESSRSELELKVYQVFFDASNTKDPDRRLAVLKNVIAYRQNFVRADTPTDRLLTALMATISEDQPVQAALRTTENQSILAALATDRNVVVRASVKEAGLALTKVNLKLKTIYCFQDGSVGATNWYFRVRYNGSDLFGLGPRSYNDARAESKSGMAPLDSDHAEATIEVPDKGAPSINILGYRAFGDRLSAQGNAVLSANQTEMSAEVVGIPENEGHFKFNFTITPSNQ